MPTTPVTFYTVHMPPTEMWVEARTWRGYQSQGFELVEYEPPLKGTEGYDSGRAKIRMAGNGTDEPFSPELCALHQTVLKALDDNTPSYYNRRAASNSFHMAHSVLFGELEYHRKLCNAAPGDTLEAVQAKVVAGIRKLADMPVAKASAKEWRAVADAIAAWTYVKKTPADFGYGPEYTCVERPAVIS